MNCRCRIEDARKTLPLPVEEPHIGLIKDAESKLDAALEAIDKALEASNKIDMLSQSRRPWFT